MGQETPGQPRQLLALRELINNTQYQNYILHTTKKVGVDEVYDERNLVILSKFNFDVDAEQLKHDKVSEPMYKKVTAIPAEAEAKDISWERPILLPY